MSIVKFYSENNRETTRAVDEFLLKNFSSDTNIKAHLLRRKETAPTKIKSFFIRMGFEIGNKNNRDWQSILPLCSLIELLNVGNYLIERDIDSYNKNDSVLGDKIRKIVLKSDFLTNKERSIFELMIKDIDNYLTMDNQMLLWDRKISNFYEQYQNKCLLVGGQFYARCLELGYLRSGSNDFNVLNNLIKIGEIFGTAYQIVHEVADFLPERLKRFPEDFKYYQMQYNSIRKRKLTLPLYLALHEWKNFNKNEFNKLVQNQEFEKVIKILLKQKIIKRAKTYIRQYVKGTRLAFRDLPENQWVNCLKLSVNSANSNIFWNHFKKLYAGVA